jgi:hypothetical protein
MLTVYLPAMLLQAAGCIMPDMQQGQQASGYSHVAHNGSQGRVCDLLCIAPLAACGSAMGCRHTTNDAE